MCNIFLTESADKQFLALYSELTDSVPGRHRYDMMRPIGSAYVKVLTPTERTIACKFGIAEQEVNVLNKINMYRQSFHV